MLVEADRAAQQCYLETTEEANVGIYEQHGFTVTVDRAGDGLPRFWTMTAPR